MRGSLLLYTLASLTIQRIVARQDGFAQHQQPLLPDESPTLQNANHLFNAIHSSMRQWGSSWFHNGMSFFLATVPAHTQFYHGTHSKVRVRGMEWLAFEPEHANMFAHVFMIQPPSNITAPQMPPGPQRPDHFFNTSKSSMELKAESQQVILKAMAEPAQPVIIPGALHTYRTKHELNLIYIDGLSAGKTSRGTMDTQNFVLYEGEHRDLYIDRQLAIYFCSLAKEDWNDSIDGFIRMEAGFEIILCDFEKNLDLVDIHKPFEMDLSNMDKFTSTQFRFFTAIASRYHSIGGNRVGVDFDNFVSAYTHDIDLWSGRRNEMPRLIEATVSQRDTLKAEINIMVKKLRRQKTREQKPSSFDWQSIADLIVTRYADPLQYLTWPKYSNNATILHGELKRLLAHFIITGSNHRNDTRDNDEERQKRRTVKLCISQFIPPPNLWQNKSLGGLVVNEVATRICTTLVQALYDTRDSTHLDTNLHTEVRLSSTIQRIKALRQWLDWSTWHLCEPSCGPDETCVIPIWPLTGFQADRERPTCRNETEFRRYEMNHSLLQDYWIDPAELWGPGVPLDPEPDFAQE